MGSEAEDRAETDQQRGCFRVSATLSNAAMNIGMHVSFGCFHFFRHIPRSGMIVLFLVFGEASMLLPQWLQ